MSEDRGLEELVVARAHAREDPAAEAWPGRSPDAGEGYGTDDPLVITYLLVMDDERFDEMTVFQGFARGWDPLLWAMHALVEMPANVLEPTWPLDGLIAQRMGGANPQVWRPLVVSALDALTMDEVGFCVVLLTGTEPAAHRATAWAARQRREVLHVSTAAVAGAVRPDAFHLLALRDHCSALFSRHAGDISPDRAEAALGAFPRWAEREPIPLDLPEVGHNCTTPNHMVLRRAGRALGTAMPHWMNLREEEYTRVVLASATAVMEVRRANGLRDWNRLYIPQPQVVLTEPALFRDTYRPVPPRQGRLAPAALMMLRRMQQQRGLAQRIEQKQVRMLQDDDQWMGVVAERQRELSAQITGIGLMAAQSCAAVLRLRPEVNHVFPRLSEFARNIRATSAHARSKSPQLLRRLQDALARAVGAERIAFLREHGGPVKIVADAPLELLPIDDLPLAMRYDTSRVNATPGNLMMGQLVGRLPVVFMSSEPVRVLVVSAFAADDPLHDEMRLALEWLGEDPANHISVDFRRVATEDEFVAVVDSSDALIMVFDGHGVQADRHRVRGRVEAPAADAQPTHRHPECLRHPWAGRADPRDGGEQLHRTRRDNRPSNAPARRRCRKRALRSPPLALPRPLRTRRDRFPAALTELGRSHGGRAQAHPGEGRARPARRPGRAPAWFGRTPLRSHARSSLGGRVRLVRGAVRPRPGDRGCTRPPGCGRCHPVGDRQERGDPLRPARRAGKDYHRGPDRRR